MNIDAMLAITGQTWDEEAITIKTLAMWNASRVPLTEFLQHGDRIDETLASYFLEAMPPACWKQGLRQMGEPYSYDEKGRTTYLTIKHQSGAWLYDGPRVLGG